VPTFPLSDDERFTLAQTELSLANIHFEEAKILAKHQDTPHACVHSSYYAMYHLATAIILLNGGVGKAKAAPKNHHDIIEHFGKLKLVQDNADFKLGQILSRARVDRTVADYGIEAGVSISQASASMSEADIFFKRCRELFKL
jgi:uncharacterized protein (UPF0332 family)